jgi:hypothetical protein
MVSDIWFLLMVVDLSNHTIEENGVAVMAAPSDDASVPATCVGADAGPLAYIVRDVGAGKLSGELTNH